MLTQESSGLQFAETAPTVILVVGVNGSGKTTSIGKLANHLHGTGRRVVLRRGRYLSRRRGRAVDDLGREGSGVTSSRENRKPIPPASPIRRLKRRSSRCRCRDHRYRRPPANPNQPDAAVGKDPPRRRQEGRRRPARSAVGARCNRWAERDQPGPRFQRSGRLHGDRAWPSSTVRPKVG